MVARTKQSFDALGREKSITHSDVDSVFADYDYEWDAASRITEIDFDFLGTAYDDTATYTHDDTNQLTDADYLAQADEDYVYDENGNRTLVDGTDTYATGDHNRMTSDGTYTYLYDDEGNRTAKFVDNDSSGTLSTSDTDITEYEWDHRNRLIEVTTYDTFGGAATQQIAFTYTHENQMIARIVDGTAKRIFVHESGQIVLQLDDATGGALDASDLSHRYLWNPSRIDALLADETIGTGSDSDVLWAMLDHLNTVRDLLRFDGTSTDLENHLTYDSFGNLVTQTATLDSDKSLFTYTGKIFDALVGLQWNLNRWYDPSTGKWISVDPISFASGDVNLYRYVGNRSIIASDPSGLIETGDAVIVSAQYSIVGVTLAANTGGGEKDLEFGDEANDDDIEDLKDIGEALMKALRENRVLNRVRLIAKMAIPTAQIATLKVYSMRVDAIVDIDYTYKVACVPYWGLFGGAPEWSDEFSKSIEAKRIVLVEHAWERNGLYAADPIDRAELIEGAKTVVNELAKRLKDGKLNVEEVLRRGVKAAVERQVIRETSAKRVTAWEDPGSPELQ